MFMSASVPVAAAVVALAVLVAAPAHAERAAADPDLAARLLDARAGPAYELSADFAGALTLTLGGARYTVTASGVVRETRRRGEPRRVDATVLKIHVPLLLRPATGSVASVLEQLIETPSEDAASLGTHDVVVLEERQDGRYYLGGIRRDIVDEAIARYRTSADARDPAVRRAVAAWLLTAPTMRPWIRRPGPPFAFAALVDDAGRLYESAVSYDWGEVGNTVSYTTVQEIAAWKRLTLHVSGQVAGLGQVAGRLELQFTGHRLSR